MITIKRYNDDYAGMWNEFIKSASNSLFMFDRGYMDYHRDKFMDNSLLFFNENDLVALLPMNKKENAFYSHGGLTYGGFIVNEKMKQHTMNDCFNALLQYASNEKITRIVYKEVPHIYHSQPCEFDQYSLFLAKAKILKIEPATVLNLSDPLKMPKGRKAQISRAKRENVEIRECISYQEYREFIELENHVLSEYHDTKAVHSADEMYLLYNRFPSSIHLFGAFHQERMIAGSIIFEYKNVIHAQYMAANDEARTLGALDLCVATIIERYKSVKQWYDFGISSENNGLMLNEGLISQKEGFGGRTNIYSTWEIQVLSS